MGACAVAVAVVLFANGYRVHSLWVVVVFGLFAAVAERQGVFVTDRIEMSVSFLPLVFTAVAFGPLAAFLAGAVSNAADVRRPLRAAVYVPVRAITGAVTGFVAWTAVPHPHTFANYLVMSLAASLANLLTMPSSTRPH